jgi:putative pyoverdin transport system ATP-binding/permease protein
LGGGIYMAWLSWKVLLVTALFIFLGGLGHRWLVRSGFRELGFAREEEDKLFGHFRSLTEGIKELKLHRERRGAFLTENLETATTAYQRHNVLAELRFIFAHGWGHLLVFSLMGLMLFALPEWGHITQQALTGYVVTTLYLMGPLAGVMSGISVFGRADVAFRKVEQLGLSLAVRAKESCPLERNGAPKNFQRVELAGVTHAYSHERDDSNFVLGPLNLTFEPGELIFIVGGNGSGKSTMAKLITGLYPPEQGDIRLNGKTITDHNRDDYRQLFSVVFADFYPPGHGAAAPGRPGLGVFVPSATPAQAEDT